jgi:hypothetical protein
LCYDLKEKERILKILALFHEKNTRDELGLGSITSSFADQLFPGTSTIHTRLRYMLFVPWIYKELENEAVHLKKFAKKAEIEERNLIGSLMDTDDRAGIFGKAAGTDIKRLPSNVYWSALRTWGIFRLNCSQWIYHEIIDDIYREREVLNAHRKGSKNQKDDIDFGYQKDTWHPALPPIPKNFPAKAEFALTEEESNFILDRINDSCKGSLLSYLANLPETADSETPWGHPYYSEFSDEHKEILAHARIFSDVMEGAAISYNFQLAKLRNNKELAKEHQNSFKKWNKDVRMKTIHEINDWSLERFWQIASNSKHRVTTFTTHFVNDWISFVKDLTKDLLSDPAALELVKRREISLKKINSRFTNQKALEQWSGYSGLGTYIFRWNNVKVLLKDLFQGLNKGTM